MRPKIVYLYFRKVEFRMCNAYINFKVFVNVRLYV